MSLKYICPFCKKELVPGEPKIYQTLTWNVDDPSGDSLERETWECRCNFARNIFWGIEGDAYYLLYGEGSISKGQCEMIRGIKSSSAINSMSREVDMIMIEYRRGVK